MFINLKHHLPFLLHTCSGHRTWTDTASLLSSYARDKKSVLLMERIGLHLIYWGKQLLRTHMDSSIKLSWHDVKVFLLLSSAFFFNTFQSSQLSWFYVMVFHPGTNQNWLAFWISCITTHVKYDICNVRAFNLPAFLEVLQEQEKCEAKQT